MFTLLAIHRFIKVMKNKKNIECVPMSVCKGGSRIFTRGGGGGEGELSKNFRQFCRALLLY